MIYVSPEPQVETMGFFKSTYTYLGIPPWDIGRPQPEFVRLAKEGEMAGTVLDVGCGTGENSLYLAQLGYEVLGIDTARLAIWKARAKAFKRGVNAAFEVRDALRLQVLDRQFDNIIDSGLFHNRAFSNEKLQQYIQSLAAVLRPGGKYFMLCISEDEPGSWGPRRVTQQEIRSTFSSGWRIEYIKASQFQSSSSPGASPAWFSSIHRL
jgi:cyclopropane fatty-acyl-phospholipid synthase-like methyltransferase